MRTIRTMPRVKAIMTRVANKASKLRDSLLRAVGISTSREVSNALKTTDAQSKPTLKTHFGKKSIATPEPPTPRDEYRAIAKDVEIKGRDKILDILDILRRDSNDNVEPNQKADEAFLSKIQEPALFHISPQTWVLITPGETQAGGTNNEPTLYICTPNAKDEASGKAYYESKGISQDTFYNHQPNGCEAYLGE